MVYNADEVKNFSINYSHGHIILSLTVNHNNNDYVDKLEISPTFADELMSLLRQASHAQAVDKIDEYIERVGIHVERQLIRGTATIRVGAIEHQRESIGRILDTIRPGRLLGIDAGFESDVMGMYYTSPSIGYGPKIKYPDMKCAGCERDLDEPQNLEKYMSQKQLDNYLKFCTENKQEPQLFCCNCFDVAKRSPVLMKNFLSMIKSADYHQEARSAIIKEENRLMEQRIALQRKEANLNKRIVKLQRNPIKLLLAQWYSRKFKNKYPKNVVTDEQRMHYDYLRRIPVPKLVFNESAFLSTSFYGRMWKKTKWQIKMHRLLGKAVIYKPEVAIAYMGYHKLVFAIAKEEMAIPKFIIRIPIPFLNKDHGIVYRKYHEKKKWKVF